MSRIVTVAGVGSLVSEASARRSFDFSRFRLGEIRGWRRAFNQANWVNVTLGLARLETWEVAALAMVPADPQYVSCVALLDVEEDELPGFYEREAGYRIVPVPFAAPAWDAPSAETGVALLCVACESDIVADALWAPGGDMERHCAGSEYAAEWMQRSLRPLWPPAWPGTLLARPRLPNGEAAVFDASTLKPIPAEDFPLSWSRCWAEAGNTGGGGERGAAGGEAPRVEVVADVPTSTQAPGDGVALYPAPGYLRGCYEAHRSVGLLEHFVDSTLLADYRTTLRSYLGSSPELVAYLEAGPADEDSDDGF